MQAAAGGRPAVYCWQIVFHYTLSEVTTQRPALTIRHAAFSHTFYQSVPYDYRNKDRHFPK